MDNKTKNMKDALIGNSETESYQHSVAELGKMLSMLGSVSIWERDSNNDSKWIKVTADKFRKCDVVDIFSYRVTPSKDVTEAEDVSTGERDKWIINGEEVILIAPATEVKIRIVDGEDVSSHGKKLDKMLGK